MLKIGDKIKVLKYFDFSDSNGLIGKVVCKHYGSYGVDFGVEGRLFHNLDGSLARNTGLYVTGLMEWQITPIDNPLNRILYPEFTPDGEGNLV
jgi:hypothetical protein